MRPPLFAHALLARAGVLVALAGVSAAHAEDLAAFFKSRSVFLEVGYTPGGAYDAYARAVARFLGRHIPGNPTIIVKNMEGAGSLRLALETAQVRLGLGPFEELADQGLQRYPPMYDGVVALVHDTHAAATHLTADLVFSQSRRQLWRAHLFL